MQTIYDVTNTIYSNLIAEGLQTEWVTFDSEQFLVGYLGKFRLRWLATKIFFFIVVFTIDTVDSRLFLEIIQQAGEYSKRKKSKFWNRGMQQGIMCAPVVVCNSASDDAKAIAMNPPICQYAFMEYPRIVSLDDDNKVYSYEGDIVIGVLYYKWICDLLSRVLKVD